jgi:hypothetical protein
VSEALTWGRLSAASQSVKAGHELEEFPVEVAGCDRVASGERLDDPLGEAFAFLDLDGEHHP